MARVRLFPHRYRQEWRTYRPNVEGQDLVHWTEREGDQEFDICILKLWQVHLGDRHASLAEGCPGEAALEFPWIHG